MSTVGVGLIVLFALSLAEFLVGVLQLLHQFPKLLDSLLVRKKIVA